MTRASWKAAINWIAFNDNPGDNEGAEAVAGYLTSHLVADLWGREPIQVGRAVLRRRAQERARDIYRQRALLGLGPTFRTETDEGTVYGCRRCGFSLLRAYSAPPDAHTRAAADLSVHVLRFHPAEKEAQA